ncbi:MAG: tRNA-dihydrouridine synthase family protein [Nanoarchaeota archaeon]
MQHPKLYLAPLNTLGNLAFRELCFNHGADFVFSEMIRTEKLLKGSICEIKKSNIQYFLEDKTIIQIISQENINDIEEAIQLIIKINPKIKEINYNMGCPQSSLCKNNNGAGILKDLSKIEIIATLLKKSCDKYNLIPSIKTRIGIDRDKIIIKKVVSILEKIGINKIYIHGRVLRESYNKPATYKEIKELKTYFPNIQIIANGDVCDINSFNNINKTKPDGIMIGRAALENPQIFNILKNNIDIKNQNKSGITFLEKKAIILEYLKYAHLYDLNISTIKSNLSYLTKNIINGSNLRQKINQINNVKKLIEFIKIYKNHDKKLE